MVQMRTLKVVAQCNGSFGDPMVNITFGQGSNTGITNSFTTYNYQNTACPNDGNYSIQSTTSGCFGNTWHTITSDHTGGGGNFMVVNASYDPGDFFVTGVNGLCPNTTYEFAAWVINLFKTGPVSIFPDLTFKIETVDGSLLSTYSTGDIGTNSIPVWNKYAMVFATPPGISDVVIRITNNAPGGYGNDLGLDDITFRPCGTTLNAVINNVAGGEVNICAGANLPYGFTGSVGSAIADPEYLWQQSTDSGATWMDVPQAYSLTLMRTLGTKAGAYWYRFTAIDKLIQDITACRVYSNILKINVHPNPVVDAGPDRFVVKGYDIILAATGSGNSLSYNWQPNRYFNDNNLLNPELRPLQKMKYYLTATSAAGCHSTDSVLVEVAESLFIPNAFTPNNDGLNDTWKIPYLDPVWGAEVTVYNRGGQQVYYSNEALVTWNGRYKGIPQPAGIYVYIIILRKKGNEMLRGTLHLLR